MDMLIGSFQHPLFEAEATRLGLGFESRLLFGRKIESDGHGKSLQIQVTAVHQKRPSPYISGFRGPLAIPTGSGYDLQAGQPKG